MSARRWYLADALTRTFRDLGGHSSTTLFGAAALALPLLLGPAADAAGLPLPGAALQVAGAFTAAVWLPAALITATHRFAGGNDPGVGGLLRATARPRRLMSLMATQLSVGLLIFGAFLLAFVPAAGVVAAALSRTGGRVAGLEQALDGPLGGLLALALLAGTAGFVVLATAIALRYGLAKAANVLESLSPGRALRRSRALVRGHRLDLFLLWLMLAGILSVAGVVLIGPAAVILAASLPAPPAAVGAPALPPQAALVVGLAFYLYQVVARVLSTLAVTHFYLALRADEEAASLAAAPSAPAGPAGGDHQPDAGEQQPAREDPPGGDLAQEGRRDE